MKILFLFVGLAASVAGQGFVYLYENQQENTPNPSNNLFNPDDYVYKPPSAVNQDNLPPRQPRISLPATRRRSFPEHPEDQRQRTPHQQARRLPPQSSEVQHKPMRSPPARLPPQFQSPPATDPPRQIQTTEVPTARFSGLQAGFPASTTSTGRFSIEDTYASLERRVDEYDKKQREQKRFQSSFAPSARTRSEGRPISTNSQSARPQQDYNTYSQQYRNIQTQPAKPLSRTNTYQEQYNNNQHRHTRPAQSSQRHNTYQEQYNNNQHRHTRPAQSSQRHNTYQEQYNNNQQRQTRPAQPLSQSDIYQEQYYNNEQRQTRPAQPQRQANTYQEQYNNNQQRQTRPAQPLRQANTYQEQYNNQQRQTRPAQPLRQDNTYQEQYNNNQQRQTQHTQPQQDDDYYQEQYNNNKYIEDQFSQPQHQSATYQQQYANNRKIRASNHVHQNDYQTSHTSPKAISQNYNSPQPSIFASQLQSPGLPASTIAGGGSKSLEEFYAELERSVIESQKKQNILQQTKSRVSSQRAGYAQTAQTNSKYPAQYYTSSDVSNHPSYTSAFHDQFHQDGLSTPNQQSVSNNRRSRQQRVRQRRSTQQIHTPAAEEYTDYRRFATSGRLYNTGEKPLLSNYLSTPMEAARETQWNSYEANSNYVNLAVSSQHPDSDGDGIRNDFGVDYSILISIPQTDNNLLGNINI